MSAEPKTEPIIKAVPTPTDGNKKTKRELNKKLSLNPIAGTRDFLPPDMRQREWLFDKFKQTARKFGFEPYDAPILEEKELYTRKAGDEIVEQMYHFEDHSKLPVAMRPEMTPSLARLVMQQKQSLSWPVKWFSIPQCWRYEKAATKQRKREHYQWNMDIWGESRVTAEGELLACIVDFLSSVGLDSKQVTIRVSSRKMLQAVLEKFGITQEQFLPTCVIIDKLDKMEKYQVVEELEKIQVSEAIAHKIIDFVNVKNVDQLQQFIGEEKEHESITELKTLFELAEGYGFADWLSFDASIVRGLSYYTGIVFEGFATTGEFQRAVCGGGRYDTILTKTFQSGKDIPACGFGFGDVVIMEILKEKNLVPQELLKNRVDDIVVPFSENLRAAACKVVTILRNQQPDKVADVYLKRVKGLGNALDYANQVGATRAIIIAPSEWEQGKVCIKYLKEGKGTEDKSLGNQFVVPLEEITTFVRPTNTPVQQ